MSSMVPVPYSAPPLVYSPKPENPKRTYSAGPFDECISPDLKAIIKQMQDDPLLKGISPNGVSSTEALAFANSEKVKKGMDVLQGYVTKIVKAWEATGPECLKQKTLAACSASGELKDNERAGLTFFIRLYNAIGSRGLPAIMKLHDDIVIALNQCFKAKQLPEINVKLRANSDIFKKGGTAKKKETFENKEDGVTPDMLGCDASVVNCPYKWWHLLFALFIGMTVGVYGGYVAFSKE